MATSREPSVDSIGKEIEADEVRIETSEKEDGLPAPGPSTTKNVGAGDAALEILQDGSAHYEVSEEEDRRVLRKIDFWVMPVVLLVYFLQQLDKSSLSYTSVFGIVQATHLVGSQYSWLTSIVYLAQLVCQPISSYLLVKLPIPKFLFVNVFLWGAVVASTAAAHNFKGLVTTRFFLGVFEASVAPAFITITQMWWRRREQTMRLSMWMAMNGVTGMVGSLLSWGLGHISDRLQPYQVIFLFIGLLTVVVSPIVFFVLPVSPAKAKFLTREEKIIAFERVRANNQGTENKVWKWEHVWELLLDFKTYLWFSLLFLCTVPSGGIGAFGPLIIASFGFDSFNTILFNIPFTFLQVVVTLASAWISTKLKVKWPIIFCLCIPAIGGVAALLTLGRDKHERGKLLASYYVISFFTGLQPMLYAWSAQNTAGHTKKLCTTGIVFVAQCAGNVVGPQLYTTDEKPYYHRGLISNMICWIALSVLTVVTAAYLAFRNKQQEALRRRLGKAGKVVDRSLDSYSERKGNSEGNEGEARNDKAFDDLTDIQNEDFIYVL
ncbi:hypothetical protein D9758_013240 [Tetrapyrgos nigripes]|uniref:Allantoate permease n=1 Tax=Tetrapyrgos nigripes TaxID=182062 RepID=A0A8H5FPH0_9AGAR|nr:hypothetical protein D9758_013240 [Tetrapyrgos nigripes]